MIVKKRHTFQHAELGTNLVKCFSSGQYKDNSGLMTAPRSFKFCHEKKRRLFLVDYT